MIDIPNDSHKGAECSFCSKVWKRGRPNEMKVHLALKCHAIPFNIKIKCLNMIKTDSNTPADQPSQRNVTNATDNNDLISEERVAKANKALVRFFVCCGVPFSIVDSPFFRDFTKSLCYGYEPPKRTTLSNKYLNTEIASISLKIEEELRHSTNLTLG